uniref:Pancreatic and duodenal homeobox 1 n=1 Tax=Sinocyclocheilus grahami TaxID=75366 RepID=A0A672NA16_SINGR
MNREEHYYPPNHLYKDSCAFQRHPNEDYSQNLPPCLYMSRQTQSVYASPSLGSQDQPNLTDITSYNMSTRDDLTGPHLHLPQTPQTSLQTLGGYGDSLDLCGDRNRYHLPFPWMKSTKSHTHAWKGQWTGNSHTSAINFNIHIPFFLSGHSVSGPQASYFFVFLLKDKKKIKYFFGLLSKFVFCFFAFV